MGSQDGRRLRWGKAETREGIQGEMGKSWRDRSRQGRAGEGGKRRAGELRL